MKSDNVDFEDAAAQYQALVTSVATTLCQYNRVTRDMPRQAEIDKATPVAKSIIGSITKWIYQGEGRR